MPASKRGRLAGAPTLPLTAYCNRQRYPHRTAPTREASRLLMPALRYALFALSATTLHKPYTAGHANTCLVDGIQEVLLCHRPSPGPDGVHARLCTHAAYVSTSAVGAQPREQLKPAQMAKLVGRMQSQFLHGMDPKMSVLWGSSRHPWHFRQLISMTYCASFVTRHPHLFTTAPTFQQICASPLSFHTLPNPTGA